MAELMILGGAVMSLWVIAAWIACAVFSAHVAAEKSRCGFCWFAWGLLFGPISLIAAAGLPDASRPAYVQGTAFSGQQTALDAPPVDRTVHVQEAHDFGYVIAKRLKRPSTWFVLVAVAILLYVSLR